LSLHRIIVTGLSLAFSTAAAADCGKDGRGPDCPRPPADFIIGSSAGFAPRPKADSRRKHVPARPSPVVTTAAGYDHLQQRVDALIATRDCNGAVALALKGGALAMATRVDRICER
jgi:hypothetical protein